jgi:SAM-dependent methyltransferase
LPDPDGWCHTSETRSVASLLARCGYRVHLVDIVELHVEQAEAGAAAQPEASFTVARGDARRLEEPDESWDVVLLLGPLYHLTEREGRLQALREARRVLRPGRPVFGAAISRFASLLDGFRQALPESLIATSNHLSGRGVIGRSVRWPRRRLSSSGAKFA